MSDWSTTHKPMGGRERLALALTKMGPQEPHPLTRLLLSVPGPYFGHAHVPQGLQNPTAVSGLLRHEPRLMSVFCPVIMNIESVRSKTASNWEKNKPRKRGTPLLKASERSFVLSRTACRRLLLEKGRVSLVQLVTKSPPEDRLSTYREVCRHFHPVFRYFFFENFPEPVRWFERRRAYVRSVATGSIGTWSPSRLCFSGFKVE